MMKSQGQARIQMGIEIKTKAGAVLKPDQLHFWDMTSGAPPHLPTHFTNMSPQTPFKYFTDAIIGLCYHKMNDYKFLNPDEKRFTIQAYRSFDTYSTLFSKSAPRMKALDKNPKKDALQFENFEKRMTEIWDHTFSQKHVQFKNLEAALDCISEFENDLNQPFLYNFSVRFTEKFTEKLICFYSFLFHLRALVAVDHNAHVEDSSFECIKCDSISDYLPKSDYTVNDALLYWQFKKLSLPFVAHNGNRSAASSTAMGPGKDKDARLEKLLVDPMLKSFNQYNHNACCLIDHLPKSFLNSLTTAELEEALHHVQMDWLLGSESGLLFKIREELFGVTEGYDKIFWPEATSASSKKSTSLNICFSLSDKDLSKEAAAS